MITLDGDPCPHPIFHGLKKGLIEEPWIFYAVPMLMKNEMAAVVNEVYLGSPYVFVPEAAKGIEQ